MADIHITLVNDGLYNVYEGDELIGVHFSGRLVGEILKDLKDSGYTVETPKAAS